MAFILFEKTGQIFNSDHIDRFFHDLRHAFWGRSPTKHTKTRSQTNSHSNSSPGFRTCSSSSTGNSSDQTSRQIKFTYLLCRFFKTRAHEQTGYFRFDRSKLLHVFIHTADMANLENTRRKRNITVNLHYHDDCPFALVALWHP